ncbi:hypothetical protein VIGAN_04162600 [Vigna angularis var. angularis]|uniref:Uncharacterized protein n=1 Tax=Vigna angularis var. angularis TaxID=157739 RepID=A0A0S3RUJ6_PHAAN|nr:hypothetical protein VIGAN_04162600 [Vigna angularis var. angularis]
MTPLILSQHYWLCSSPTIRVHKPLETCKAYQTYSNEYKCHILATSLTATFKLLIPFLISYTYLTLWTCFIVVILSSLFTFKVTFVSFTQLVVMSLIKEQMFIRL